MRNYKSVRFFKEEEKAMIAHIIVHIHKDKKQIKMLLKCGAIAFMDAETSLPEYTEVSVDNVVFTMSSNPIAYILI